MKPTADLVDEAMIVARQVAQDAYGAAARVDFERSSDSWHRTLHRHIFEQQMSVWKHLGYLDVIANELGHVVGYVDHEAYRRADDAAVVEDVELRGIVMDSEFLPAGCKVLERMTYPGPEGGRLVGLTVEGSSRLGRRRWLVEVNAARRLVASIRPLDTTEKGQG